MEKLIVAPYVTVGIQKQKLYIGFGSIQFVETDLKVGKVYLEILRYFKEPHTFSEASKKFAEEPQFTQCWNKLKEHNVFITATTYNRGNRHSRQALFFNLNGIDAEQAQKRLASKKVAIIGCGGIGNQVSVHLATAGVEQFILCDADIIETSNLSRQILFKEEDAGQLKAEVLRRELLARYAKARITTVVDHITRIEQLDFSKDADFIVVSADTGNVVNIVNQFCVRNKVPYMNVGYVNDISVWGPLYIPGETGCYSCQDIIAGDGNQEDLKSLIREINTGYQAPSVGPVNMTSSGLACLDILKFLAGHPERAHSLNRRVGLWTHSMRVEYQDCSKNPNCRVCGSGQ